MLQLASSLTLSEMASLGLTFSLVLLTADVIVTAMAGWNPKAMELLMRYRVREGSPEWDTYVAKVDGKIQGVALCIPAGQAHPPKYMFSFG